MFRVVKGEQMFYNEWENSLKILYISKDKGEQHGKTKNLFLCN